MEGSRCELRPVCRIATLMSTKIQEGSPHLSLVTICRQRVFFLKKIVG
jgi:hypothetical protein